jgi:phosphatidylglycerol:prolipoprotein diacylglycerol transferase
MYPRLFEIGPITVYTYGLLLALAYLGGLQLALVRARQRGLDPTRIMDLGIWIIVSALVGAKLMLLLVEWDHFSHNPSELLSLAQSGGVFYGGLILAVGVALWYLWRHKMPAAATAGRPICPGASRSPTRFPTRTSARRCTRRCIRRSCTKRAPSC